MKRKVYVTGTGVVSSIGDSSDVFWRSCLQGKSIVEEIPLAWRAFSAKSKFYAPLSLPDYQARGLKKFEVTQNDPATLNALLATAEALQQANFEIEKQSEKKHCFTINGISPYKVGVFIGTGAGGCSTSGENLINEIRSVIASCSQQLSDEEKTKLDSQLESMIGCLQRKNTFSLPMSLSNSVAATVATKYGIKGPVQIAVYSCAAGTKAICEAFNAIQLGLVDVAITGGTEYTTDYIGSTFNCFDTLKTLTTYEGPAEKVNRPFDRDRQNFLFSEGGCGILVLENDKRISSLHVKPLAEVVAVCQTFDSHHFMQLEPKGREIRRMIAEVLKSAGISAAQVDYINAHGTGTVLNDALEAEILEDIFSAKPYINSTKSILGHTLGASGALESIVCTKSLSEGKLHPSLNIDNPVRPLNFVTQPKVAKLNYALNVSYGFGGHNAAVIFKQA
ncbi:beta-ketoacyl-[acyl-carrier-protein] synthase family protein [Catenovulum sediminis]|uniref:Nodulation protein E n=1 Tax=Catenovulum sediminis TaxID=1740262 RepID=A0ABV1RG76_9ALTE